ncbi:MAG: hypothetical protein Q7S21_04610 [archaeon]|nr:hypothetical protein [archaeon]
MESWMTILVIIGIISTALFALSGFQADFSQKDVQIQLNASLASSQIQSGEEINITATASSSEKISSIVFQINDEKKTIECSSISCNAEFSKVFDKAGAYSISITAIIDGKTSEQRKLQFYVLNKQRCADGTSFNECSANKPAYCNLGILSDNCSLCSCSGESACQSNGKCSQIISLKINSAKVNDFNLVNIARPFNVFVELFNNSGNTISKNTSLKLDLIFSNAENLFTNSYNFVLENDLLPNASTMIEIKNSNNSSSRFFLPQTGSFDLNTQLVDENNKNLSTIFVEDFLDVVNDSSPPANPTGLSSTVSQNDVNLSWNMNSESDIAGYNIYQSTSSNTLFIASTKIAAVSFNENSFSVNDLNSGNYFFVITAFDIVGNESAFSNQTTISIS